MSSKKLSSSCFGYALGYVLRSLKLGVVPGPSLSAGSCQPLVYTIRNSVDVSNFSWNDKRSRQGKESSILTRSCLSPLAGDSGAPGYGSIIRLVNLIYRIEVTCSHVFFLLLKDSFEKVASL